MLTWMFLTPLWYPLKIVMEMAPKYLHLYLLNPMASFVALYRFILYEPGVFYLSSAVNYAIAIVLVATFLSFFVGYFIFNKLENDFAKEL